MSKSPDAFRTISEVAEWLGIQAHVLRFWESKFTQIKPVKRAGGRRYYRPGDMLLLGGIKKLLHEDGVTIKGVQKLLRDQGTAQIAALSPPLDDSDGDGDGEIIEHDGGAKVLAFTARPPESAETPTPPVDPAPPVALQPDRAPPRAADALPSAPPPESPPAPAPMLEPHPVPPETALPAVAQDVRTPPSQPDPTPQAIGAAAPDRAESPKPQPRALIVEAPDPPPESQIRYRPGPLAQLCDIDRLSTDQARAIAPLAQELRAILTRHDTGTKA